ncbi:archaea-specific SMC-related protein [Natronolimnohabitans innermongolicus]|uniref:Rad50 ATPase n=1 Tax=Natronolimnohabitans innermongolicus JCM 12255 TaxID=1227499 RepID=L9WM60_9EURY|nr:archaea-specific SMC-related protein [Natronolimnohabitans innermongolicus]ELY50477.1 rad50 ATPase [Natronolimnohabitans innermongolicus JCM 12255]
MSDRTLHIELENIGGIERKEVSISAGATFIQGPNAANKSSLLKGLLFALGSRDVPIRSGADEARVRLSVGDESIERVARRTDAGVKTNGDAWVTETDDVTLLERFAGLLETNSLRSAVARNDDVESLLKEPMNIEALEAQRSAKMNRKRELTADIESAGDVEDRLENTERELGEKRDRLDDLESTLEALYDEQETTETDDALQELREERADLRSDEADCETQIDQLESAIDRLKQRRTEIEDELEAARDAAEGTDVETLKNRRESARSELDEIQERLEVLQSALTANREMLDSEFTGVLGRDSGLMGDEVTCWTCGRSAPVDELEETVAELNELVEADKRRKREREPEIDDLTEQIEDVRQSESEVKRLETEKRDLEQKLESRRDSLKEQRERRRSIRDRLDELDDDIADRAADQRSEQSELTGEIEETRVEIQTLRREIERLEDTCESLRETRVELEQKREDVERLSEEITALTDRIENLETELRTVFNETMDDLLDVLEFDRIERVWLDGEFELVIAREIDGRTQSDSIEHLAESEREMIGLVLALAGFVTFDVTDVAPVLALDSLGAFDDERTRRLVEYFADESDFLVATAHPESTVDADFETVIFESPVQN